MGMIATASAGATSRVRKARTSAEISALEALDAAVDANLETVSGAVLATLTGLWGMFAAAEPSALGPASRAMVEAHYRSMWVRGVRVLLAPAIAAGASELRVPGVSVAAEYEAQRGAEWPTLMAKGQLRAWAAAKRVARDLEIPEEDAHELIRLATGITAQDAGYLVRQQAGVVKATEDSLPAIRKRLRAAVLRRTADLMKRRAVKTAEYELAKGYNDAVRLAHAQALKIGLASEVRATWITALDEDVCKVCGPLHGKSRVARAASTLYNRWGTPDGSADVLSAPAHIKCRCTIHYEITYATGMRKVMILAA